jgi:DNA-directed RNA polymerase subunit RPC12/RpoP
VNEPEYANRPTPDRLYLCGRCKRGILVFLGTGNETVFEPTANRPYAWCYVCGSKQKGIAYRRVLVLRGSSDGGEMQSAMPNVRLHAGL